MIAYLGVASWSSGVFSYVTFDSILFSCKGEKKVQYFFSFSKTNQENQQHQNDPIAISYYSISYNLLQSNQKVQKIERYNMPGRIEIENVLNTWY